MSPVDISPRRFRLTFCLLVVLGAGLRAAFLTADPPYRSPVGITWHDEGPWVHNARNRALWGTWSTDAWNPMYLSPVFTGLEYAAFDVLGVGLWQARTVSLLMGLAALVAVTAGVAAIASRRAALAVALLLATNHAWVQWNRVALLETTMVAFIAIAWGTYALAARRRAWGFIAGCAAVLAFFAKAASAFFVAALTVDAIISLARAWRGRTRDDGRSEAAGAWFTLAGLAVAGGVFAAAFVLPHWSEFRFYNWQMSVVRKPAYGLGPFIDRASWVPVVNEFFARMWPLTVLALAGALASVLRWRTCGPAERLLALWVALGTAELIVHDAGNERRLIFFVPVIVVLGALVLFRERPLLDAVPRLDWRTGVAAAPAVLYAAYLLCGALARVAFAPEIQGAVRSGAAAAVIVTAALYVTWPRVSTWLSRRTVPPRLATGIVLALALVDLAQYAQWAAGRTYKNVEASALVGSWLPPGTLVQGKLANGLALDNRIKPIFVGRGFGNYDDRFSRDDARYLLTYVDPRIGYEGPVIRDVLEACPGWRILRTFDVAETATGHDRAALILKAPHCAAVPPGSPSAKD